jgi:hypothetical protein
MYTNESKTKCLYFAGVMNVDEFINEYYLEQCYNLDEGGYFSMYDVWDGEAEYNPYYDAYPFVIKRKKDDSCLTLDEAKALFSSNLTINTENESIDYYTIATLWFIENVGGSK